VTIYYWPRVLPGPQRDGYIVELQDTLLRSAMDAGPGKVRRRFTTGSAYVSTTWLFTRQQLDWFHIFYTDGLNNGADLFLWPDPWIRPLALSENPNDEQRYAEQYYFHIARFRKLNQYKLVGGTRALEGGVPDNNSFSLATVWEVSSELEVLPRAPGSSRLLSGYQLTPEDAYQLQLGELPLEVSDPQEYDLLQYYNSAWRNSSQSSITDGGNYV